MGTENCVIQHHLIGFRLKYLIEHHMIVERLGDIPDPLYISAIKFKKGAMGGRAHAGIVTRPNKQRK